MILDYVAFVVGGNNKNVEVYSPDGKCQYNLAPIPNGAFEPILAYIDDRILACGGRGNKNCNLYHPSNDSWSVYSTSSFTHSEQPGEIYDGKIFIADDSNPEVFDPASKTWYTWTAPLYKTGGGPCLVAWKDIFILFGGFSNRRGVQTFNHSTDAWQELDSSSVPIDIYFSSCILLPNDDILIVGSEDSPYRSSAALYNIRSNAWKKLPDTSISRHGASLITLGTRVFAMDSDERNVIEEYHYNSFTWSPIEAKLIAPRYHHGTLSLPSEILQHLPFGCTGVH